MALGCAIIAYNRPHYLKWLLHSLENQEQHPSVEYHLFLDGARTTTDKVLVSKCKRLFELSTLNGTVHERKKNASIAVSQFEAKEYMSKYEYFIMAEDDILLSKYALRTINILKSHIKGDAFSVGHNFKRRCKKSEIKDNLDKAFKHTRMHWWFELYKSENWQKVKPHFVEYYDLVKDINYRHRNHRTIQQFFRDNGFDEERTSQDAGMDYALHKAGMCRVSTVVNRGMYLGKVGTHFREELYDNYEFIKQTPFLFKEDANFTKFVI